MRIARALVLCLLPSLASAQPVQVLHAFGVSPSRAPNGALLEAPDGSFYGTSGPASIRRAPDGQVTLVGPGGLRGRRAACAAAMARSTAHAVRRAECGGHGLPLRPRHRRPAHAACVHRSATTAGTPFGGLVEVGGQLYGVTTSGGPQPAPQRDDLPHRSVRRARVTVLHAFSDRGATPAWFPPARWPSGPDGMLYGTTRFGGAEEAGTASSG